MKTYLTVFFNSEGARPSEITDLLHNLGFKPIQGAHDFVYDWGTRTNIRDVIWFGDRLHTALKGTGILYKLETLE